VRLSSPDNSIREPILMNPYDDFLPPLFVGSVVFLTGLIVGSFLNVCIYRLPRERSVVFPPSACPNCDHPLSWFDNIPVVSWLWLRGRCRYCSAPISSLYPLVEMITGIFFFAVWWQNPDIRVFPFFFLVTAGLIVATFIDFFHYIIPDEITLGGVAVGLIVAFCFPEVIRAETHLSGLLRSVAGIVLGGGGLFLVAIAGTALFKKEAMGMGDVKLLAAVGAFLGPAAPLFALVVGSVVGSIVGLILLLFRKARRDTAIPFGPYLALGAYLYMLCGPAIIQAYLAYTLSSTP
jgi:leader peptidase (prepilin peptidase)/N-methyltransferase